MTVERELAERHYAEHAERPFFGELVQFITSGPIVAFVLEGHEAVRAARQVIGATDPIEAASGSIRGDFALQVGQNLVHGSDSPESAARESALFFSGIEQRGLYDVTREIPGKLTVPRFMYRTRCVVESELQLIQHGLAQHEVAVIQGSASLEDAHTVRVEEPDGAVRTSGCRTPGDKPCYGVAAAEVNVLGRWLTVEDCRSAILGVAFAHRTTTSGRRRGSR